MAQMAHREDRTLGDLFRELTRETGMLIRQEIKLAKAEVGEKISQAGRGAIFMVSGGVLAFAGLLFLLGAAVVGLNLVMPLWLACLAVGILTILIGLALVGVGRESVKTEKLALSKTAESLREDKQWAKAQMP